MIFFYSIEAGVLHKRPIVLAPPKIARPLSRGAASMRMGSAVLCGARMFDRECACPRLLKETLPSKIRSF
ncbi:hypothetical protein Y032_0002g596 [Ancylostoma ceylanicum]|uniref:Uncharacterized protein n=1 Tax=Ancylostoma ceylanicum TaxID=53326 RepID=A0A016W0D9_9BILA|nr:hypothetical protein Y032_0002g596 [Ancylostoma ceylanicum]